VITAIPDEAPFRTLALRGAGDRPEQDRPLHGRG
jgi:hypothetical protein